MRGCTIKDEPRNEEEIKIWRGLLLKLFWPMNTYGHKKKGSWGDISITVEFKDKHRIDFEMSEKEYKLFERIFSSAEGGNL